MQVSALVATVPTTQRPACSRVQSVRVAIHAHSSADRRTGLSVHPALFGGLSDIHHLNAGSTYPDGSIVEKGVFMFAISLMGATPTAIFFIVAFALFVLAGIGFKPAGDRVHLVGLGLAAYIFVLAWNALAAT